MPIDSHLNIAADSSTYFRSMATPAMAHTLTKDYLSAQPDVVRAMVMQSVNLSELRHLTVNQQTANAPLVTSAPAKIERTVVGQDGTVYFVKQARLAKRSKVLDTPYLFLERRDGDVYLQAWFELVRFASLPSKSKPLPMDQFSVSLVGNGGRIDFDRCDELPPSDKDDTVLSQLFCETKVDLDQALGLLQEDQSAKFKVEANVHYSLPGATPAKPKPTPKPKRIPKPRQTQRYRAGDIVGRARATTSRRTTVGVSSRIPAIDPRAILYNPSQPKKKPTGPTKKVSRLALGAKDNIGVQGFRPTSNPLNRAIYAQVTTGFGSEPWSEWVTTSNGRFMNSPIPDQFYVLADDYRLAFNPTTGLPAMEILLVPPDRSNNEAGGSFSEEYKFRCRFGIVPWVEPARMERLREEITKHTGIVHPKLVVGGMKTASCKLSRTYDSLGSSLVGEGDATIEVDPHGFDLVVDCTTEFYRLLSRLLATDGVTADVSAALISDDDEPPVVTLPVLLRLDRPAFQSLEAELIEPEAVPVPVGEEQPLSIPRLRITNRSTFAATVERLSTTLLVVDPTLPTPIGAVQADPTPTGFTIPAAVDGVPASLEVDLAPRRSDLPPLYGAVDVSFVGLSIDIDPQQVLDQVHDLGASTDIFSTLEVRSYQMEHPDVLPASHTDVFGIEAQFRRGDSDPITVFITRDQPKTEVQVSFSVADMIAGARPEQPKFSWRRRNMAGSGTGSWSEWAETIGRQLFVSPEGL